MSDESDKLFRELQAEFLVHELKNPVSIIETGVRSLLEQREKNGPLSDRQEKTLNRTLRSSKKIRKMLDDLLEVGRSEAGFFEFSTFQPSRILFDLLQDVLETLPGNIADQLLQCEEGKKSEFLSSCGVNLEIIQGAADVEICQDKTKFIQIAGNLIQNAFHYRKKSVGIKLMVQDDDICIEVADDGPGINPDQHRAVFQRYNRLKESSALSRKGHGLGLTGARIMARCLGGDIELISEKGKGTVFQLFLPVKKENTTE